MENKLEHLKEYLKGLGSVAVAFSSGVDSTFLLKVAHDVLGDKAIAITAQSCSFPKRELNEAKAFCEKEGIQHVICQSEELEIEGFSKNPPNRCYLCKKELFEKIGDIAKKNGIEYIAEGSNMDDNGDYRPGLIAVKELGVKSPLREAKLTKAEIREYSKELGLPRSRKTGPRHRLQIRPRLPEPLGRAAIPARCAQGCPVLHLWGKQKRTGDPRLLGPHQGRRQSIKTTTGGTYALFQAARAGFAEGGRTLRPPHRGRDF